MSQRDEQPDTATLSLKPAAIVRSPQSDDDSDDELRPGTLIGDYVIQRPLARGGFGAVYSAEHRTLGRRAALKLLHRDLVRSNEITARFLREARAVNLIGHPNIVDIYDIGMLPDGRPYHVMALLPGRDLKHVIESRGRLSASETRTLFEPLCDALHATHEAGIVHRDLKASNVMIGAAPVIDDIKLLDFGVAKLLDADGSGWHTTTGRIIGTPVAMAPEQIRGAAIDRRTDVYALGVLLFQVLTGRLPFQTSNRALLEQQHLTATPPRPSELAPVSCRVDAVVARAMAKPVEARYTTAMDLWRELSHATRPVITPAVIATERADAVGIYVTADIATTDVAMPVVRTLSSTLAEIDTVNHDDVLDCLGDLLDDAEEGLTELGLTIALQTRNAVLGTRLVGDGDEYARALDAARTLRARLAAHPSAREDIAVSIRVHADQVTVHEPAATGAPDGRAGVTDVIDVIGGPLADPRRWPTARFDGRISVTDTFTDRSLRASTSAQSSDSRS